MIDRVDDWWWRIDPVAAVNEWHRPLKVSGVFSLESA